VCCEITLASAAISSIPSDTAAFFIPFDAAAVPTAASTVPAAASKVPSTDIAVSDTRPTVPAAATSVAAASTSIPATAAVPAAATVTPLTPAPPALPSLFGWQPNASASFVALTAVFSTHLSFVPPFLTASPVPSTCTLTSAAMRSSFPPCCTS